MSPNHETKPCKITHREGLEGYHITEEHYRDMHGNMRCACTIVDPEGKFHRRYACLEDAMQYLRAHLRNLHLRNER